MHRSLCTLVPCSVNVSRAVSSRSYHARMLAPSIVSTQSTNSCIAAACSTVASPISATSSSRCFSSSSSSSPPPRNPSWFRRNLLWITAAGIGIPILITLIDWSNEPKSTPANIQPAAEKHIPGTKRKKEKVFAAAVAAPPAVSAATATEDSEPSPTHADHASCRACREGESTDMNATLRNQLTPPAVSASTSTDAQSTPIQRTPAAAAVSCPPCYAYSHSLCPLNRAEVGRAAWGYLHTMVAYYPDSPSQRQKDDMSAFINLYMKLYPCGYCADRSMEQLEREPIEKYVGSQLELSGWMCRAHNEVNERLGKPIFDCAYANQRWRDGPPTGECD